MEIYASKNNLFNLLRQISKVIEVTNIKESLTETFNLLWKFNWYIAPYMLFYLLLLINYLIPSPKNYCIWDNEIWYTYAQPQYLRITELMLIIFLLLFLVGTSNMRNHPTIAKCIFLSSLWFLAVFLQMV